MRTSSFVQNVLNQPSNTLLVGFNKSAKDPNCINLGTAENKLVHDLILPKLQNRSELRSEDLTYAASFIFDDIYEVMAKFYKKYLKIDAKADQFICGLGIGHLVEKMGLVFCEPGEIVLIPVPCYGAFMPDLTFSRCVVEFIDLENLPSKPPDNARLLILTDPGNPYGEHIKNPEEVFKWAYQNPNLHIVCDEVYALSNRSGEDFKSLCTLPSFDPMRVHQCYGISKDFGLSGLHWAIMWSANPEVIKNMKLSMGCSFISSDVTWEIKRIFSDEAFIDMVIKEYKKRLIKAQSVACDQLDKEGIKYKTYDNALFIMIDFTEISGKTEKEEDELFLRMIDEFHVYVIPGISGFRCPVPGWFRLCFSLPEDYVREGIRRLGKVFKLLNQRSKISF